MSTLPDPELNREAAPLRSGHSLLACVSVALGLAVLSTSNMAQAQGQPSPPAASPPVAAPQPPPAAPVQPTPSATGGASAPAAAQPAPAPTPAMPPAGAGPGAPQGAQGYGYPPPPQGYGYPAQQGAPGQTQPGYGPYPYPYPYYPQYYPQMTPPQRYERNSSSMMTGGIVLTTAGIIGVLVGSSLASTATNQIPVYCEPVGGGGPQICEYRDDDTQLGVGVGIMVAGFVGLGVGIPLWVIGGKRVPVKDQNAPAEGAPAAPQTSMQLFVNPQGASVRLSF